MIRIARSLNQSIPRVGHLSPLVGRGLVGLRSQWLFPCLPQLVEDLLIEVGTEIRLFQEQAITSLGRRFDRRGGWFVADRSRNAKEQQWKHDRRKSSGEKTVHEFSLKARRGLARRGHNGFGDDYDQDSSPPQS
jgi:hypothetical protein